MVAAYRSHTSAAVDNTNITINKPAGVVDGDLLVCGILNGTSTNTTVNQSSAGWTQVRVAPGAEACLTILTKVAASEPASWTFVPSAAHHQIGVVVAISGASGNVEVGAAASANDTGGSDDGIVTATLTTTLSGVLVAIAGEESNSGAQTFTHTGGSFTERLDTTGTSDTHIGLYTQDGTAAGAKTITVTSTDTGMDTCAVMVLVEDAGGGGPATIEATASGAWGGLAGAVTADKTVEATTSGAWGALAGTVTVVKTVEALTSAAWGGLAGTVIADVSTPGGGGSVVDLTSAASDDDGRFSQSGTTFDSSFTDLRVGDEGGVDMTSFVRMALSVPQGATISNVLLTLQATATASDAVTVEVQAVDADDADAPTTAAEGQALSLTTASVTWTTPSVAAATDYDTPDISSVIQEVVDRAGWASGNHIVLILRTTSAGTWLIKDFRSRDYWDTAAWPRLNLDYEVGSTVEGPIKHRGGPMSTGFELDTNVDGLANGWTKDGASTCTLDASRKKSGATSQRIVVAGPTAGIHYTSIPVTAGVPYQWVTETWVEAVEVDGLFVLKIEWLDSGQAFLDANYITVDAPDAGWVLRTVSATAPTGAVWARPVIQITSNGGTVNVDDARFMGPESGVFNDADPYVRVNGVWQRVDVMYRRESGQWVRYM